MRTGIATRRGVPAQDPLLDFPSEPSVMYPEPLSAPASWPVIPPPTHAIDTTSRVISFVLGFALASLIAWLGSISSDDVATTRNSAPVTAVGTPVVAATIEEKKPATNRAPEAPAPTPVATRSPASAPPAVRATADVSPARAVVPPKTAEPVLTPKTSRPAASGYRGALALTSSPEGAQVVLNGKVVGQTPVVLNDLPVGSRAIIVRRDGYSAWSASVRVVANQRTTVRATLIRQSGG
jgi:PEGA domain-containing protein